MAGSWRMPQGRAVDAVRWLPSAGAAWDRLVLAALFDSDTGSAAVELSALFHEEENNGESFPWLEMRASWPQPARITALGTGLLQGESSLVAAGSVAGSVGIVMVDAVRPSAGSGEMMLCPDLHENAVSGVDIQTDTRDCLSVGEDGKISLVKLGQSELHPKCLHDSHGLVSFSAVHWASPMEFVTAGVGAPLQWWDLRRPGGAVSQCRIKWDGLTAGFVHCIDVHSSRKHLCVVGGSAGSVFAWDLRWQQEAIRLAGVPSSQKGQMFGGPIVESEVWQVRYDHVMPASTYASDSRKVPPVMICSEDGVLATIEGGNVNELLAEPCAINTFDIDPEHGKDIICGLEHESILYLKRDT